MKINIKLYIKLRQSICQFTYSYSLKFTFLNVSHVHIIWPPIWIFFGRWVSDRKIKYKRRISMGSLIHSHWTNSTPNSSNWLVTFSPDTHVTKLNPNASSNIPDSIIISNCFELSSHFKRKRNKMKVFKIKFFKLFSQMRYDAVFNFYS